MKPGVEVVVDVHLEEEKAQILHRPKGCRFAEGGEGLKLGGLAAPKDLKRKGVVNWECIFNQESNLIGALMIFSISF